VTRGRRGASWTLVTPDNHYVSRLAVLEGASVVKLVTPRMQPARFGQYLVSLEAGGGTRGALPAGAEHFLYVLSGTVDIESDALEAGGFAYLPPGEALSFTASGEPARLLWLKRPYETADGFDPPAPVSGNRADGAFADTPTPGVRRRELLGVDDPGRDFAMSILQFDAGCGLPQVEIHDEEHGLWMTAGGGTYFLDGEDLPVEEDDFIYMAPYCPQSFRAGPEGGEYLLYKDAWRDGF
jgi:(S)-ureidoglycine aminohydrolase